VSILSALLWASPSPAAQVTNIAIIEYGLYELQRVQRAGDDSSAAADHTYTTEIVLMEPTDRIPARLGAKFGLRYQVGGNPLGARVDITIITRFPEGGLEDPETATVREGDQREITSAIGDVRFFGFELSKPWELKPGRWRFELWSDGRKMAEQTFTVQN
jgi:hypothetical protein